MRMLFVMDPLADVRIEKDTTFALMLEAQARGHELFVCGLSDLSAAGDVGYARAARVRVARVPGAHHEAETPQWTRLSDHDVIWMRKDPPVDMEFVYATYLLERLDPARTLVVNRPSGLRDANEKVFLLNFPQVSPSTIVTRDREAIRDFVWEQGGRAVIKPLDRMGGAGIFVLRRDDPNLASILEASTVDGTRYVMVQRFLPEAAEGDKRVLLIDGEPLGAILRVPPAGEFRGNMAVGGKAVASTVTARDLEIVAAVAPELRRRGLWFVGLDVIGGLLTEINVTSPTGVQEVEKYDGPGVSTRIVAWAEDQVAASRAAAEG